MSEEYALHGKMSERSDIFSFGVNLLEIVTGKRNIEFCNYYHGDSMLDYVWRHFDEGNSLQVVDPNFVDSSLVEEEVVRCIQVALLCVQQDVDDRPSTESVALMLATTMMEIP
ncbi:PREDICTED: receptor-like serine/threonine-protein kinase SD1-7, partial [Camelina sativa]